MSACVNTEGEPKGGVVTHEMGFAREVAHQVYFTDKGLIVEHGAPQAFFDSPQDPRTREFLGHVL